MRTLKLQAVNRQLSSMKNEALLKSQSCYLRGPVSASIMAASKECDDITASRSVKQIGVTLVLCHCFGGRGGEEIFRSHK